METHGLEKCLNRCDETELRVVCLKKRAGGILHFTNFPGGMEKVFKFRLLKKKSLIFSACFVSLSLNTETD